MNADDSQRSMRGLRNAAGFAFAAHLTAGLAMAIVLRPGLASNSDLASRMQYLAERKAIWLLGWGTWNAAAISMLYFVHAYERALGGGARNSASALRFAVAVTAAAVAIDLAAEAIQMGVLPELAAAAIQAGTDGAAARFGAFARAADAMSGVMANGLYVLAVGLLVAGTRGFAPRWLDAAGWVVVASGAWLSAAALAGSVGGMIASNVVLMPALLAWYAGVAWKAGR